MSPYKCLTADDLRPQVESKLANLLAREFGNGPFDYDNTAKYIWQTNFIPTFCETLIPYMFEDKYNGLFYDLPNGKKAKLFGDEVCKGDLYWCKRCEDIINHTRARYMGECRQLGTSSRPTGPFAVELRLEPPIQTEPNRLKRFNRLLGFPIEGEPTYKKFEEWLEIDYKKEHRVNKDVAEMIYGLIEEEKGQA